PEQEVGERDADEREQQPDRGADDVPRQHHAERGDRGHGGDDREKDDREGHRTGGLRETTPCEKDGIWEGERIGERGTRSASGRVHPGRLGKTTGMNPAARENNSPPSVAALTHQPIRYDRGSNEKTASFVPLGIAAAR